MGKRFCAAITASGAQVFALVLWCVLCFAHPVGAEGESAIERAIKATFLAKFAAYVEWPPGAFPSLTAPLAICVVGADPFGDLLERAASGERLGTHPVVVRRLAIIGQNARQSDCRVVYAGGSPAQPVPQILALLQGSPVLTVTDSASDPRSGAIIQFVVVDNHVRFLIDAAEARADRLQISSKLLSLAVNLGPPR